MAISIKQIGGLEENLNNLLSRIQDLEDKLNVLTNNGEITKIEVSEEEDNE
jgi:hypothetical protein